MGSPWIRSVDTNPVGVPTRPAARRPAEEPELSAKQATAVCLLCTDHLRAGTPLRAKGAFRGTPKSSADRRLAEPLGEIARFTVRPGADG